LDMDPRPEPDTAPDAPHRGCMLPRPISLCVHPLPFRALGADRYCAPAQFSERPEKVGPAVLRHLPQVQPAQGEEQALKRPRAEEEQALKRPRAEEEQTHSPLAMAQPYRRDAAVRPSKAPHRPARWAREPRRVPLPQALEPALHPHRQFARRPY
jgi:hypothetical protein